MPIYQDSPNIYYGGIYIRGRRGPTGPVGPQGPQGLAGEYAGQGVQGTQGVPGSQGPQGESGSQGPQGVPGSFVSVGPQGSQGSQGVQGAVGAQGSQGVQGSQGPQGTIGVTGAQGVQGSQGITGTQGAQGSQGTQGVQGHTGNIGPQGAQGAQGSDGSQGAQGAYSLLSKIVEYVAGSYSTAPTASTIKANNPAHTSATELKLNPGTGSTIYSQLHSSGANSVLVLFSEDGSWSAVFLIAGNVTYNSLNNYFTIPVSYQTGHGSGSWPSGDLIVEYQRVGNQGPIGAQGVQGTTGATGSQGAQGATGPQGPQGLHGLTNKGTWSGATAYVVNDFVTLNGTSYVCIVAHTNHTPPNVTYWQVLAQAGSQGVQGAEGPTPSGSAYEVLLVGSTPGTATMGPLTANHIPSLSSLYAALSGTSVSTANWIIEAASGDGLRVSQNGSTNLPIESYGTGAQANLAIKRGRGTRTVPTAAQNGDVIGGMTTHAYSGSTFLAGAYIKSAITGAQGATNFPTNLTFGVTSGTQSIVAMTINSDGTIAVGSQTMIDNLNAGYLGGKSVSEVITDEGGTLLPGSVVNFLDDLGSYEALTFDAQGVQNVGAQGTMQSGNFSDRLGHTIAPVDAQIGEGFIGYDPVSGALVIEGVAGADGTEPDGGEDGYDGKATIITAGDGGNAEADIVDNTAHYGGNGASLYVRAGAGGLGDPGDSGDPPEDFTGANGEVRIGDINTRRTWLGPIPGSLSLPNAGADVVVYNGFGNSWKVNAGAAEFSGTRAVAYPGGRYVSSNGTVGTSATTGEVALKSVTLPQNALHTTNVSGQWVMFAHGVYAANTNGKRIVLKIGSNIIFDTGVVAANAEVWSLEVRMEAVSSGIARFLVEFRRGTTTRQMAYVEISATYTGTLALTLYGQNSVAQLNDILCRGFRVDYLQ